MKSRALLRREEGREYMPRVASYVGNTDSMKRVESFFTIAFTILPFTPEREILTIVRSTRRAERAHREINSRLFQDGITILISLHKRKKNSVFIWPLLFLSFCGRGSGLDLGFDGFFNE